MTPLPTRKSMSPGSSPGPSRSEPGGPGSTGASSARAQAALLLPAELLQPGEIIVLMLKPSAWYILLRSLYSLSLIALLTFGFWYLAGYSFLNVSRRDIILLGSCLAGARLFWQFLEWLSRVYVLTDQRVIRVKGVLQVQVFECALKQIQHTECLFSFNERLLCLGTIRFSTAGTALPEAYWEMLAKPLEAHQTLIRTLNRYR
ncbi:MAG: PH domain-containing protein [Phycisphaeraceae bacterium]|nr:PH domain-containing protein [Phycisphaeraceae bacterium]